MKKSFNMGDYVKELLEGITLKLEDKKFTLKNNAISKVVVLRLDNAKVSIAKTGSIGIFIEGVQNAVLWTKNWKYSKSNNTIVLTLEEFEALKDYYKLDFTNIYEWELDDCLSNYSGFKKAPKKAEKQEEEQEPRKEVEPELKQEEKAEEQQEEAQEEPIQAVDDEQKASNDYLIKLNAFMSEFTQDKLSIRQLNALMFLNKLDYKHHLVNYYKITGEAFVDGLISKCNSPEFDEVFKAKEKLLNVAKENNHTFTSINKRLELHFGDAGSGKTYNTTKQYPDAVVIPCSATLDVDDLNRLVVFENGQPQFIDTPLIQAMQEGKPIIFDEIRLLNNDVIAWLQTILDNKKNILINNKVVNIKEGFKIVGTFNLMVNGYTYPLPQPLVDRAYLIKEYTNNLELQSSLLLNTLR